MTEKEVSDEISGLCGDVNDDDEDIHAKASEEVQALTLEAINGLMDAIDAMELAEDHDINIEGLVSFEEIQTRLKCHLKLVNEGNLKEKVKHV